MTDRPSILFVVGRPSRFDIKNNKLLAGDAEDFVHDALAQTFPTRDDYTLTVCEAKDFNRRLPPTCPTHIIATGQGSVDLLLPTRELNEVRGFVSRHHGIPIVHTFQVQDCCDRRNYDADAYGLGDEDEDDDVGTGKDHAATSWMNYTFWFRADVRKLFDPPAPLPPLDQRVCSAITIVHAMSAVPDNAYLYFDIETHPPTDTVQCFSFKWPGSPTYSFTCYDFRGNATGDLARVFAALARLFRRAIVVGHNIAGFDLPFMAHYHGLPWGPRVEDTMFMWHRCHSEIEKSLGHVISALLNEPFHKGTACFTPYNYQQQHALLHYNAKDVHTLEGIHQRLVALGDTTPGLRTSMAQVNSSIPVYLLAQFRGFELNMERRSAHQRKIAERVAALTRVLRALTGLPDLNPNSSKQLIDWMINGLGYKPKETTDSGEPSMDATSLYQYRLDYPRNVALTLLLALKKLAKQGQMLGFEPYNVLRGR